MIPRAFCQHCHWDFYSKRQNISWYPRHQVHREDLNHFQAENLGIKWRNLIFYLFFHDFNSNKIMKWQQSQSRLLRIWAKSLLAQQTCSATLTSIILFYTERNSCCQQNEGKFCIILHECSWLLYRCLHFKSKEPIHRQSLLSTTGVWNYLPSSVPCFVMFYFFLILSAEASCCKTKYWLYYPDLFTSQSASLLQIWNWKIHKSSFSKLSHLPFIMFSRPSLVLLVEILLPYLFIKPG